ncbi:MAG: 16S rRNA (cytosine(1402)-N(4))-methyltransferase RsmH [Candidatus Omnitrophota bacterium]|nr:16S rRNA (cytosine(1402)-N(4))-methyltransferase RsmH [Candidatus Omnitrophota bacterium]
MLHIPVMSKEILQIFSLRDGDIVVDCTIGTGGHSEQFLRVISPQGRLIGIDRDIESLNVAKERLKNFQNNLELVHEDFRNLDLVLKRLNIKDVDAFLFDLGVSSFQLDNPERGFSLKSQGPLDMRFDKESYILAYDLVNYLSEQEISSIIQAFGQERFHNRIARFLVKERNIRPISTTQDLSDIVLKAIPYRYHSHKIHPATQTFQAFRIAVNRELESLEIALEKSMQFLRKVGHICVVSFHSLEERIVKEKFIKFSKDGLIKILTKRPLRPTIREIRQNLRCRSARLRAAERI